MEPLELQARLTALKASQGVGKTHVGLRAVAGFRPVLLITHLQTLTADLQTRFNEVSPSAPAAHYRNEQPLGAASGNLAIVVNSLHKLRPEAYRGGSVYIDEVSQLLDAVAGEHFDDRRAPVLYALKQVLCAAARVVVSDRDVQLEHVQFLLRLMEADTSEAEVVHNSYLPAKRHVRWHPSEESLRSRLGERLGQGKKVFVASDSKKYILRLRTSMESAGHAVKVVAGRKRGEAPDPFVGNINEQVTGLDALLVSPALFTGVDIHVRHFDDVYVVAHNGTGRIRSTDFLQAMRRVREPLGEVHVWVTTKSSVGSGSPTTVASAPGDEGGHVMLAYRDYLAWSERRRREDVARLHQSVKDTLRAEAYNLVEVDNGGGSSALSSVNRAAIVERDDALDGSVILSVRDDWPMRQAEGDSTSRGRPGGGWRTRKPSGTGR